MSPVISTRKRVTRAGRDAHAIYLPKAWIDAWSTEQQAGREVNMVSLDDHLIISPMAGVAHRTATLHSDDADDLCRALLSSYVAGHREYRIAHADRFSDAQLVAARRFVRLLDERADMEWDDHVVRLRRDPLDPPRPTAAVLLDLMGGHVLEAAKTLAELLEFHPHNPERVLHAVQLLSTIERDDLQRIKNQTYRFVARFEVPASRVADLQMLLLCTHTLARMGKLLVEGACTITDQLGVPRDRLHYPAELLEKDLQPPRETTAAYRAFLDRARRDLQRYIDGLQQALDLFDPDRDPGSIDGQVALRQARDAAATHEQVSAALLDVVQEQWGPGLIQEDPAATFRVVKVHVHVQDLHDELRILNDRVADFRLAETLEDGRQD